MDGLRSLGMGQSHHHGGIGTLLLRQHNVVHMPEAAAAPIWSGVGDRSAWGRKPPLFTRNTITVQTP